MICTSRLDKEAHRAARRYSVIGLGGLVTYWAVVFKLSESDYAVYGSGTNNSGSADFILIVLAFFSPLGWVSFRLL